MGSMCRDGQRWRLSVRATQCLSIYEIESGSVSHICHLSKVWVSGVCRVSCAPTLPWSLAALRVFTISSCRSQSHPWEARWDDAVPSLLLSFRSGPATSRLPFRVGSPHAWCLSLVTSKADSLGSGGVLGLFLKLVGVLLVFFTDLVELPHVLEEVGASLERDEKLGLLAVAPIV